MAHITLAGDAGIFHKFWTALDVIGRVLATAMAVNSSGDARLREIHRLQALSDAKLAEMGIPREKIVQHVFRDIAMI